MNPVWSYVQKCHFMHFIVAGIGFYFWLMLVICHRNGWTNILIMKLLWMEQMLATTSAIFLEVALPFFRSRFVILVLFLLHCVLSQTYLRMWCWLCSLCWWIRLIWLSMNCVKEINWDGHLLYYTASVCNPSWRILQVGRYWRNGWLTMPCISHLRDLMMIGKSQFHSIFLFAGSKNNVLCDHNQRTSSLRIRLHSCWSSSVGRACGSKPQGRRFNPFL